MCVLIGVCVIWTEKQKAERNNNDVARSLNDNMTLVSLQFLHAKDIIFQVGEVNFTCGEEWKVKVI